MSDRQFRPQTQLLRKELLESMAYLFSGDINPILLETLRFYFPWLSFALLINWLPEQGEDIYWVLIDSQRVAVVEIPRETNVDVKNVLIEAVPVSEYQKRTSTAVKRRKFKAALDLMREKERE